MQITDLQMKRALRSVLIVLLLSVVGMIKMHADVTIGNLTYYFYGNTAIVTGHKDGTSATGELIIPETVIYNGNTYAVTSIGSYAFQNCSGLTGSLNIPSSVTSIGYGAFRDCSGFTGSLTIPNSVTTIGSSAFSGCSGFTGNLTIPNSVTTIGSSAFLGCTGFTGSLTIGNNVTTIGAGAFWNCRGFTGNLIIPNSVTSIGGDAFVFCIGFTGSLTIGNSVTTIGNLAFFDCSGFTGSLIIPNSVTTIGEKAFSLCGGFEFIGVESGNTSYDSRENCNAIIETSTNVLIKGSANSIIPNSVTSIAYGAFGGCSGLIGSLTIPNSVTSIGDQAFSGCSGLTGSLIIPNSVTEIGYAAFRDCGFTGDLVIPNSVTTIGNEAFSGCGGFTGSLTIPNSVTTIGSLAFQSCRGFTGNLTIPNSITTIGFGTFNCCYGFNGNLTIPEFVSFIDDAAFFGCQFTSMDVFAEVPPTLGSEWGSYYVFENNMYNIPVTLPCGMMEAYQNTEGWNEFTNYIEACAGEIIVTVNPTEGGTVTGAGYYEGGATCILTAMASEGYTFVYWMKDGVIVSTNPNYSFIVTGDTSIIAKFSSIEDWNLPIQFADANVKTLCVANWDTNGDEELSYAEAAAVTDLGEVFKNASLITSFDELQYFINLTSIGNFAFRVCRGLTSIEIPNAVTSIGYEAFRYCTGLTSIEIPNSVTTIGKWTFMDCSGLTSIEIPKSVTSIGECAFSNCIELEQIIVDSENKVYDSRDNCDAIIKTSTNELVIGCKNTVIPNSVTSIGYRAFFICSGLTSIEIPNAVTSIGYEAFRYCSGLTSMTIFSEIPPLLGESAFNYVNKSIPVYVPVGTVAAYQAAPGWNEFTNYHEIESTSYTITASANPAESGSVTGGGSYAQGTTCTLTAIANEGYSFVNWTENNEVVSTNANYSFTVSGNRNLVANFALSGTITNHWTPEGSSYSEIMAMYSVIQIDGVEQYSNTLEVGVFCGDECRGSAIASEFNLTHRYLAILNVFGENGHQLTFKLYDHSIGQELNLTSPATVTFDVNGYGNPLEPYVLNFTSSITHSQALNSGWNWWSTYIEQDGIDGLGMLENSIGSAGVRIQGRNGTIDQFEYQGSSYWYGSLTSIENEQMYKIRTNAACNAVMVGYMALPANHPITINGGWNWIGFPCSQSVSVNDAMSGFTPVANDVIKGRNGSTTYVSYGSNSLWYGTLNTLEPGQGYMYKSNSNTSKTLVFQTGRGEETVTNVAEENSFFTPNTDDFSDNMLVTAVIDMDGQELRSDDYEVAAYVGNECRGSVRLMYVEPFDRYVAFLLVFGEAEEEIHFVLTDGNEVSWSNDLLIYTADGLVGTLTEPATLHFGTLGLNNNEHDFVNIFPNPSNGIFNIEGNGLRKIEVVNAFGQTVLLREVENNLMQIDLGDKAAGVYLLRVITNNGITTKQLIKE